MRFLFVHLFGSDMLIHMVHKRLFFGEHFATFLPQALKRVSDWHFAILRRKGHCFKNNGFNFLRCTVISTVFFCSPFHSLSLPH